MFYLFTFLSIFAISLCCLAVGTKDGEPSHQVEDVFAESENVNDIQEDVLNDISDEETKVSLISYKHIIVRFSDYNIKGEV